MITKLNHQSDTVARQIYSVFQRSYAVEAELIGVHTFPPLSRTKKNITHADSLFFGYTKSEDLAGVIEVSMTNAILMIDSLTVNPEYFRNGIANELITYVMQTFSFEHALVETAATNQPAIKLYEKHGFVAIKQWIPSHGIEKIAFKFQH